MKIKWRRYILGIGVIVVLFIMAVIYFKPKPLKEVFETENVQADGLMYITVFDISNYTSKNIVGPAMDLLAPANDEVGSLLHDVSISGPVFYRNTSLNSDLMNLYIALPLQDGNYQRVTIELLLSRGEVREAYSVFINVNNKGYFVTAGKEIVAEFIQRNRN